jgi:hypothetical protein
MQVTASVFYLIYAVLVTKVFQVSLSVAWGGEALYWIITLVLAIWYLRSNRWASISV